MGGELSSPRFNDDQAELLVRRQADDEELLRKFGRTHGVRHVERFRPWLRTVRADIGAYGVITELYARPDGELGAYFYIEAEPAPLSGVRAAAQGTPVVTSAGRSTEEVAGGAAVLVDPLDVDAIADGLASAVARADELSVAGRVRAGQLTWTATAAATRAVYDEAMAGGGVTT